jgi:hypothetical protein
MVTDPVSMVTIELTLQVASKSGLHCGSECKSYRLSIVAMFVSVVLTPVYPWLPGFYE